MLNLKKWMAKVSNTMSTFRGFTNNPVHITLDSNNAFVAPNDGWVVAQAATDSPPSTLNPVIRVGAMAGGTNPTYAEATGIMSGNSAFFVSLPVKKGVKYYIGAYRSTISFVRFFKEGGVISYLIHLTESLKSFVGKRWARYAEPQEIVNKDTDCADSTASSNTCERCNWMGVLRTGRAHGDSTGRNKREYSKRFKRSFSYGLACSAEVMDCGNYSSVCSHGRLFANIKRWSTRGRFRNSCRNKGYSFYLFLLDGSVMAFIPREGVMAC